MTEYQARLKIRLGSWTAVCMLRANEKDMQCVLQEQQAFAVLSVLTHRHTQEEKTLPPILSSSCGNVCECERIQTWYVSDAMLC